MRQSRLVYVLALVVLMALVVWSLVLSMPPATQSNGPAPASATQAPMAPELDMTTQAGVVKLSSLRGKVVLIDAWATWCPACRESMPFLETLHKRYKSKGLVIIGLAMQQDPLKLVAAWAKEMGITYTIGQLHDMQQYAPYNPGSLPNMVLVDRSGRLRWQQTGFGPSLEPTIEGAIKELL